MKGAQGLLCHTPTAEARADLGLLQGGWRTPLADEAHSRWTSEGLESQKAFDRFYKYIHLHALMCTQTYTLRISHVYTCTHTLMHAHGHTYTHSDTLTLSL